MLHITLLAVFLAFFLGLAGPQGAVGAASTPEEKLAEQLYLNASLHKARIPPLKQGQMRIFGALNSLGPYSYDAGTAAGAMRGCSWEKSRFAVMGHDSKGGGSAWFYADIDEKSGQILTVTAYGNGICGSARHEAFFAASPLAGSFGKVEMGGFTLRAAGPGVFSSLTPDGEGPATGEVSLVITGGGDLLEAANGAKIPVRYYLGGSQGVVLEDKDPTGVNTDSGRGTVTVERYREAGAGAAAASRSAAPDFVSKVSDDPAYGRETATDCADRAKPAQLPPRKTGSIRIYGVLKSVGMYNTDGGSEMVMATLAGADWTRMDMRKFGRLGSPLAWFLADVDTDGTVLYARVYACGEVATASIAADLRKPVSGSYGKITDEGWEISVGGISDMVIRGYEEEVKTSVVIRGKGNLLSAVNGEKLSGRYVLNTVDAPDFTNLIKNADYGSVTAHIVR